MRKTIVCFGDSNTYGYDPTTGKHYSEKIRWTARLQDILGDDYKVIEEGQNGRTIANADPAEWGTKCGMDYVLPMIESHMPVDLLIIMLGSNDLKDKFHLPAPDIAGCLQNMVMRIKAYAAAQCGMPDMKILLMSPPALRYPMHTSVFGPFYSDDACEKCQKVGEWYALVAKQFDCAYLNVASLITASEADHLHLDPDGHKKLAELVAQQIQEMGI